MFESNRAASSFRSSLYTLDRVLLLNRSSPSTSVAAILVQMRDSKLMTLRKLVFEHLDTGVYVMVE